jgi:hypothetical protein
MHGTKERTLRYKRTKNTQLKFCKTMTLPCLMYGSEILAQKKRRKATGSRRDAVHTITGYTVLDKERSCGIRSQLGMRKLNKQVYEGEKHWLEQLQRLPSERAPRNYRKS